MNVIWTFKIQWDYLGSDVDTPKKEEIGELPKFKGQEHEEETAKEKKKLLSEKHDGESILHTKWRECFKEEGVTVCVKVLW